MQPPLLPLILLMGVSVAWYLGLRLLGERAMRRASVAWQAMAFTLPLALLSIVALWMQRPLLAMQAILAAGGMSMTASVGLTLLSSARQIDAVPSVRLWPIPAGLMLLLLGTGGLLSPTDCGVILLFGVLCLSTSRRVVGVGTIVPPPARPLFFGPLIVWPLVVLVLGAGALLALWSATKLSMTANRSLDSLLGIVILGPAVVLPLTMHSMSLTRRGDDGLSLLAIFATLLATVLLPATLLAASLRLRWPQLWVAWLAEPARVTLSLSSVRLSGIALAAGGLLLMPMLLGRRKPAIVEAVLLVLGSMVYLVLQSLAIL